MKQSLRDYVRIARPDHWIKNLFIVPGMMLAVLLADRGDLNDHLFWLFICGMLATCLVASANYVINEWLDAEFDRFHPTKKNRPVVAGNMKFAYVMTEYALLAVAGILLSLSVNLQFFYTALWLLIMGIVYNVKPLRTKDIPYLDVISESVNNMIRLLLGWFIITDNVLPPVSILFGYWMAGAFLMAMKRFAEYRMIGDPKIAGLYRKSFRYYSEQSLLASSFFYALCSTFFIGVFLIKYRIEYVLGMPLVFLLFSYYALLSVKEDSVVQKPEKLYREKKLLGLVALVVLSFLVLTFADIELLNEFQYPNLLEIPE